MIVRIISAMILVSALYVLAVFVFPQQADELGDVLGIRSLNAQLRLLKSSADAVSERLIQAQNATGGVLDDAKNIIDQTKTAVGTAKSVIETKTEQAKRVYDSAQKTTEAINELKSSVGDLASLTGSVTASGSASSSTSVSSGR